MVRFLIYYSFLFIQPALYPHQISTYHKLQQGTFGTLFLNKNLGNRFWYIKHPLNKILITSKTIYLVIQLIINLIITLTCSQVNTATPDVCTCRRQRDRRTSHFGSRTPNVALNQVIILLIINYMVIIFILEDHFILFVWSNEDF